MAQINAATGGLLGVFIVLFVTHWLTVCRLVRAQVCRSRSASSCWPRAPSAPVDRD